MEYGIEWFGEHVDRRMVSIWTVVSKDVSLGLQLWFVSWKRMISGGKWRLYCAGSVFVEMAKALCVE